MEMNTIVTLIGSLGFPIVCCGAMFWYINTTMKQFTETMNQNTKMIEKLVNKLNSIEKR
ncbi:MAG: hypothetical protein MJZ34_14600 [Paludibacteraceae bacterium]|nr:hypothetical protein [Paludibacteraceae bacterium]